MPTELRLAQHGMGMQEATIIAWHKREGESFVAGELLVEVEAAKTTVEVEAQSAGTLIRIVSQPDDVVAVGAVLAEIDTEGTCEASGIAPATQASSPLSGPAVSIPISVETRSTFRRQVEPPARRLAKQNDIDLSTVTGTGPGGRIIQADIEEVLRRSRTPASSEGIALKGVRGAVARKMMQSLQRTAQLTLVREVDVTTLEETRKALKAETPISFTEMLIVPVARTLRRHPMLNATLENDMIVPADGIHIGIAVQTEAGLVVPVLHGADTLSLRDVPPRFRALVSDVKQGRADAAQMSGGTFSITNLGPFDIDAFTPILNAPQVAILGVGRIVERYMRTADGGAWRKMLTLSLTFDHRAVDGVPAAEFLKTLASELARPDAWSNG